jgi:hypothetical protein
MILIIFIMLSCVNFEVKFVRRQMNSVVHTLAGAANTQNIEKCNVTLSLQ